MSQKQSTQKTDLDNRINAAIQRGRITRQKMIESNARARQRRQNMEKGKAKND